MSYDRALTVFTADGHLMQIEYAMEAVQKGACAVAVQGKDSIVICAERKAAQQLQDSRAVKKILQIDDNIYLAFAGLTADARVLAGRARLECQNFRLNYEEPMETEFLARFVAHMQQRYTQSGGRRPFGISTLIAGVDEDGKAQIFMTEPSGYIARWYATACGRNHKTVLEYLEKNYEQEMNDHDTLKMAVRGLLEVVDQGSRNIEVVQLSTKAKARFLPDDELDKIVKEVEADIEAEESKTKPRS